MILLSQKLNGHIQNSNFATKVEGEKATGSKSKKEGYADRTQLKMTKELVDAYNQGDQTWDEKHIYQRTEKIGQEIITHWKR